MICDCIFIVYSLTLSLSLCLALSLYRRRALPRVSWDNGAVAALDAGAHLGAHSFAVHLRLRSIGYFALPGRHPAGRAHTPPAVLTFAPRGAQGE